jgi:hypothetical protein
MPWNSSVGLMPVAQIDNNSCAPACVQMILSSMGMTRLVATDVQPVFTRSIQNIMASTYGIGSPIGVAYSINRFNTGGFTSPNVPPPLIEYRPLETTTPYEACATIIDGLVNHRAASAVFALRATHWIVAYGAEGEGNPADGAFSLKTLLICNPDNGRYGGNPRAPTPRPENPDLSIEEITYASFISTYFTGCLDGQLIDARFTGKDGVFIAVTSSRAAPAPGLLPPYPQYPRPYQALSIQASVDGLLKAGLDPALDGAEQGPVRRVLRGDRNTYYYLVPFALRDKTGQVIRLDANGAYAGRAFGSEQYVRLLFDGDGAIDSTKTFAAENGLALDPSKLQRDETLLWMPSAESASPYRPFDLVTHNDDKKFYVSQGGFVSTALHDRGTGDTLRVG